MMTVASVADIAARVSRPLTPGENSQAEAFLVDAEAAIRSWGGGDRLTDPDWSEDIISVTCAAVIRAMRLPTQLTSVVPDLEGAGFSSVPQTQGAVYLRRDERRTLGLRLTGSVNLTPRSPSRYWPFVSPRWWG